MPKFNFKGKEYNNPAELAIDIIGGKYKMPILWRLRDSVWHYGELKKDLGRVTHKVLSEQLHELEEIGLIHREAYPVIPPKVEYSITEKGKTVIPLIEQLRQWGLDLKRR
jgi:DNA-binding HxlR family transcriptional regulator